MNILILGGGGREHALAWAFAQNPKCDRLWCAPGNAGIAEQATCVPLDILNGDRVLAFCRENAVDFVMIGPEAPLAEGVADDLRAGGVLTLGPGREAAMLEASKDFTKEICAACGAPTADEPDLHRPRRRPRLGRDAKARPSSSRPTVSRRARASPWRRPIPEALAALDAIFDEGPGARVVVEEFMSGEEASLFVLADGETFLCLGTAQDHKRAFDGDTAPTPAAWAPIPPPPS